MIARHSRRGWRIYKPAKAAVAWEAVPVPSFDAEGWQLESGVARHSEAPESFAIPDEEVRRGLVPSCDAKLIFAMRGPDGAQVERMWVRVTGYTDTGYVGVLNNEPQMQRAPIALGDRVEFGPDHIIDALPPESWNPETGEYKD